jgi:alkylation response protein AidB-like acyl-CoA dehydrogenase
VGGNADYCVSTKRREGDVLVLSASKPVVTGARYADWVFCTTRASPEARGNVLSMVAMPGLGRSRDVKPFGAWDCVGMRATESSGLEYTECRVPAWHQIGPEDSWPVRATSMTVVSRAGFSAVWLGIAQAAYAQTVAHVTRRAHQYIGEGRREQGQEQAPRASVQHRVADYETVQRQVAEMRTQVEAARQLLLAAGRRIDELRHELRGPQAMESLGAIQDLLWTARIACGEASIDVTRVGLRVCGVTGMRRGLLSLERNMRDALTSQVMAPSEDVTKLMLGRKLLGVPPPDRSRSGV